MAQRLQITSDGRGDVPLHLLFTCHSCHGLVDSVTVLNSHDSRPFCDGCVSNILQRLR